MMICKLTICKTGRWPIHKWYLYLYLYIYIFTYEITKCIHMLSAYCTNTDLLLRFAIPKMIKWLHLGLGHCCICMCGEETHETWTKQPLVLNQATWSIQKMYYIHVGRSWAAATHKQWTVKVVVWWCRVSTSSWKCGLGCISKAATKP